jgi:hypothetical protein
MYELGADLLTGSWDGFGGWTSADVNHLEYDGASYSINEFTFLDITPSVVGCAYKISFEITSITGACATNGVSLAINGGSVNPSLFNAIGTYDAYFINSQDPCNIVFVFIGFVPTVGDTMSITINSFQQVTDNCWVADYTEWTYSYDATTGQGKYCSIVTLDGDLVNTSAYATDNNYHRVTLTITDSTAGGLEVILGGVYLGTTTGNGEFTFYGVPTDLSLELILRKVDSFDGCVSLVDVDDFGLIDNTDLGNSVYKLEIVNASNLGVATDFISFEVWDDRIIWCFNVSDLTNSSLPIELACTIDYKLKITAQCLEVEPVEYVSTTVLRYNTDGWDCTFIMSAYSDGYAFGFYFGSVTAPLFYLTQRLRILQFAPKYPAVGEDYLYSNGSFSRSFAQSGKVRQAWFDYVDEACHDVIRLQILSDVLTLDSDVYFAPLKDYEPEWDEHRYNLAQSRIDLVKEETLFNRSCFSVGQAPCTTNVVTIPPSTMVGYEMIGTYNLTDVDDGNFSLYTIFNQAYVETLGNDVTTLGGRNALLAYISSFITSGLNGSIINSNIIYVAPVLDITIIAIGDYTSTYSAVAFGIPTNTYPNVVMLQPT